METNITPKSTIVNIGMKNKIPTDAIINIDADINYTVFTMNTGHKITVSMTLKKVEAKVSLHKNFVRVNKSTILNTDYARLHENTFVLPNERIVEFSRRKWKKFQIENPEKLSVNS